MNEIISKNHKRRWWKYTLFVSAIRIAGYFVILIDPIAGVLLSMLLDWLDALVFGFGGFKMGEYHAMDKPVDHIQYLFMIPAALSTEIAFPFIVLLIYRYIGLMLFYITKRREMFLYFPNFTEYLFIFYFALRIFSMENIVSTPLFALLLTTFKIWQEWFIHIKRDLPDAVCSKLGLSVRLNLVAIGFAKPLPVRA